MIDTKQKEGPWGLMTVHEFIRWSGLSMPSVYRQLAGGRLLGRKIGRKTVIRVEDAEAWRDALPGWRLARFRAVGCPPP